MMTMTDFPQKLLDHLCQNVEKGGLGLRGVAVMKVWCF